MWGRAACGLRRAVFLIPLALTAGTLFLLPRPTFPIRQESIQPSLTVVHEDPDVSEQNQNVISEGKHTEDGLIGEHQHGKGIELETSLDFDDASKIRLEVPARKRPWYMKGGEHKPWKNEPDLPMFPEEAPNQDRITNQLMYKLQFEEEAPIKKIYLANGISAWNIPTGRTEFKRNNCPVDRCSITNNLKDAESADAILFKEHHVSLNIVRPANQIWILYYLECPYHTSPLRPPYNNNFNWTATYRRDSDIVAPYERWVYHDANTMEQPQEKNYAANKTKKVAWFVSNCHARNYRLQYARKLSKYISVDIYGACGSHQCPRSDPNCLAMLDKDYKFYLAFENSNCQDYITEKFFLNGLQHDILPIVMGARPSEYAAVAPHNSYIHIEEFAGPQELAAYLHRLDQNDDLYNSYFKWKGTGEFINTFFFCRVCAMLHANDQKMRYTHYNDVVSWWSDGTCIKGEWRNQPKPIYDDPERSLEENR